MYPCKAQEEILSLWIERGKWIYNLSIQERQRLYSLKKNSPHAFLEHQNKNLRTKGKKAGTYSESTAIFNKIKEFKNNFPDLKEFPSVCIDEILVQSSQAYDSFFKNIKSGKAKKGGYKTPLEKKARDDFSLKCKGGSFEIVGNRSARFFFAVPFEYKRGSFERTILEKGFKVRYYTPLLGEIRTLRIVKDKSGWYLCVTVKKEIIEQVNDKRPEIGVDLGITKSVALSNDTHKNLPYKLMEDLVKRKKVLQRRLKRKKRGSQNQKKAYARVAKLDRKIANIRKYYSKMFASEIAWDFSVVAVENLNIKNMTKSAKGTIENPGKNVKAKSGLNRAILNTSPYFFKQFLKQKCEESGSILLQVDPKYTSQTCFKCKKVDRESRVDSKFVCMSCGHKDNADFNAAKNILFKAKEA